jgi:hypothetical protein
LGEGGFMKFKNLNCNILDILGEMQCRSDDAGPFNMRRIYIEFSDIPDDELETAIMSLDSNGLLKVHEDKQKLNLTPEGIAKVKTMQRRIDQLKRPGQQRLSGCSVCEAVG